MLTLLKQVLETRSYECAKQRNDVLIINAGICGLIIHLFILILFFNLEVWPLFLLNIVSCTAWATIIYLGALGRTAIAIHTGSVEVISHSLATTMVLGPAFGFHFYLFPMSILIALNPTLNSKCSAGIAAAAILLFAYLNAFEPTDTAVSLLPSTLTIIHTINIVLAGFAMMIIGTMVKTVFSNQQSVLEDLAQTDELTRVYNRRYALSFLQKAEANRRRNQLPYCVCICDLDKFKEINDTFGHGLGDDLLVQFAGFLQDSVRETDCVARWGGEEFLIVLAHTEGRTAESVMNNMLDKLRSVCKIVIDGDRLLSTSIGIAEASGDCEVDDVVVRADKALYKAKADGRDKVVYFAV